MALRILIADDDPIVRMVLGAVIDGDPGLELAGEAEDAAQAVAMAAELDPDVALLDLDMPEGGGRGAAARIRARLPRTRVIVLSADDGEQARLDSEEAGAAAYLVKGAPPEEIVSTIARVAGAA